MKQGWSRQPDLARTRGSPATNVPVVREHVEPGKTPTRVRPVIVSGDGGPRAGGPSGSDSLPCASRRSIVGNGVKASRGDTHGACSVWIRGSTNLKGPT